MHICQKLTNHPLLFSAFGWTTQLVVNFEKIFKIFDENSIDKLNFYFWKFVTKNIAFGSNTIFLQQFSVSGGWEISPLSVTGSALAYTGPSIIGKVLQTLIHLTLIFAGRTFYRRLPSKIPRIHIGTSKSYVDLQSFLVNFWHFILQFNYFAGILGFNLIVCILKNAQPILPNRVIYTGFFGWWGSTECLEGTIFRGWNEILLLGTAPKFGVIFHKYALI